MINNLRKAFFLFLVCAYVILPDSVLAQSIRLESDGYKIDNNLKLILCNKIPVLSQGQKLDTILLDKPYALTQSVSAIEVGKAYEVSNNKISYKLFFTGLPTIQLTTKATISENDDRTPGSFQLSTGTGQPFTSYMGIRVRGGLSRTYPKKSYNVALWKDAKGDKTQDASLLGMREDNGWLLLAMYNEPMRTNNVVSHDLWLKVHKLYYADKEPDAVPGIHTRYCDVFLNDSYAGVYLLTEKVDRKQLKAKKTGDDGQVRGVIYKTNKRTEATAFTGVPGYDATAVEWDGYEMEYPDSPQWPDLYELVKFVVTSSDADFKAHIGEKMQLDNLIDYFLFTNLIGATDNMGNNQYLARYKEGDPYFYIPWDFDGTFGFANGGRQDNPREIISNGLFNRLLAQDPNTFKKRMRKRWFALRNGAFSVASLEGSFAANAAQLTQQGAYVREALRWPGTVSTTELPYMNSWTERRVAYLDQYFSTFPDEETCTPPAAPTISANVTSLTVGQSAVLTATGCSYTVVWNTGQSGSSLTVSPTAATTYTAKCQQTASCISPASASVTIQVSTPQPDPGTDPTPATPVCAALGDQCSGNSSEIRSATLNITAAGNYPLKLSYRAHEKPSVIRMRINGGSWQTYNVAQTSVSQYSETILGNVALKAGSNTVELSSGDGYVCFRQVCASVSGGTTTPTPPTCTPPAAPTISANVTSLTVGQSAVLTATGCSYTVVWNTGQSGTSLTVSPTAATSYSAKCQQAAGCESGSSNTLAIQVSNPQPDPGTNPPPTTSVCVNLGDQCSGNQSEVRSTTLAIGSAGNYPLKLTYRAHEKPSVIRMRINGGSWQTYNVAQTSVSQYSETTLGNVTLKAGSNTVELSSGDGYVCFRQVCTAVSGGTTTPTPPTCTPPAAPTISANVTSLTVGQSAVLTATGCSYTVVWNTGQSGTSLTVSPTAATSYSAKCQQTAGCESGSSNTVAIQVSNPQPDPGTDPTPTTPVCVALGDQCSGNQFEVRTYSLDIPSAGSYSLKLTYRAHEKPSVIRMRVNGGAWQTYNVAQTSVSQYSETTLGNVALKAGSNTVELSSSDGYVCFRQVCTTRIATRISALGVEADFEMTVAPNPSNGAFKVNFYGSKTTKTELSVIDLYGRSWFTKTVEGAGWQQQTLVLPQTNGVFIVQLRQGNVVRSKRVVVQQ